MPGGFRKKKRALIQPPVLGHPLSSPEHVFILDSDASQVAIGAVLSQMQFGVEKPIAFASKTLNSGQRQMCTTYREMWALTYFTTRHFRHFLLGRKFVVRVDHFSLRWILNFKDQMGMIGRWVAALTPYIGYMEIRHRAGKSHNNADGLSRLEWCPKRQCGSSHCADCWRQVQAPERPKVEKQNGDDGESVMDSQDDRGHP